MLRITNPKLLRKRIEILRQPQLLQHLPAILLYLPHRQQTLQEHLDAEFSLLDDFVLVVADPGGGGQAVEVFYEREFPADVFLDLDEFGVA
jgi:hypothetical protein